MGINLIAFPVVTKRPELSLIRQSEE
jgi:hypothetical protein